jgi:alpha-amylase
MKTFTKLALIFVLLVLLPACKGPAESTQVPATATFAPVEPSIPTEDVLPTPTLAPTGNYYWWNDTIFYEIFVRSFKDSNGDGIGDFNGLIQKLDYLNDGDPSTTTDLGITGIWLMPINESPSYHGYDVVDYHTVDQEYGSVEDFKRLIDEAHKRGISVIIDLVINHSSSQNPWFIESNKSNPEYRDWYIWEDPAPDYFGPWGQPVWYAGKEGYYYAVFWSEMPDLNLKNPAVTQEIYDISRFWLEEMGVDGFRMDAILYLVENGALQKNTRGTHAWLQAFHQYYKSIDTQAFTVGEAWTETSQVVEYVGDEVDIAFEFDLAESFVRSADGPLASSATNQMKVVLNTYPEGQFAVFLTNHDQDRVMSLLESPEKAKLAATMLLTSPGVPFIYYGEEIGMTGTKPDENIRRPMQWSGENSKVGFTTGVPWNAASRDYKTVNVGDESEDPNSLLNFYRTLIQLRNDHPSFRTGETLLVKTGTQDLYAMLRYNNQEAFLVLVNAGSKPLGTDKYSLSLEKGPFTAALTAISMIGLANPASPTLNANGGFDGYQPFPEIPAQSSIIIQLK